VRFLSSARGGAAVALWTIRVEFGARICYLVTVTSA
jgi:hypothetical protein